MVAPAPLVLVGSGFTAAFAAKGVGQKPYPIGIPGYPGTHEAGVMDRRTFLLHKAALYISLLPMPKIDEQFLIHPGYVISFGVGVSQPVLKHLDQYYPGYWQS
eukprot:1971577-Rhodomonas_salina.1